MKSALLTFAALLAAPLGALRAADAPRPNILWISCEDASPWMGFCGEKYAITPHLDRLARGGVYYTNAFATAPVCSPCRYAIITGAYATTFGTQRLRSEFAVPEAIEGFPASLRRAGYYCTNNSKTDYNTSAEQRMVAASWDESSNKAHWRNRKPGQPFFAVFNLMETHQSWVFESAKALDLAPTERHDPRDAPVPPYYPDTPTARRTLARVHDCITAMDKVAGRILAELEQEGLDKETIVFFWSDHGQGIPRGKRTLWDSGMKVPLVVSFPEKYRHLSPAEPGSTCPRLVSLMDLGPTLLSLLDLPIPAYMQGRAFLGKAAAAPRQYLFGARDRVDEVLELARSARDQRYLYVRHFMPDLSWNQPETFSDQLALRREITGLAAAGKLNAVQLTYAGPRKPAEALYDTQNDPWQIHNLADDLAHRPVLERMRKALRDWQVESRDLGLMHEWQAAKLCADHGRPLVELGRMERHYPLDRVLDTAWRVGQPGQTQQFMRRLGDPDPTVRYWAALGLRVAGAEAAGATEALKAALADPSLPVRIEAAGVLVAQRDDRPALELLARLVAGDDEHAVLHAARTLQMLGEKSRPVLPALREALPRLQNMFSRWAVAGAIERLDATDAKPRPEAPASGRGGEEPLTPDNVPPLEPNRADEPLRDGFSMEAAVRFLDTAALRWQKEQKCFACHSDYAFLIARPVVAWNVPAHRHIRAKLEELAEHPRDVKFRVTEGVMVASVLAQNDALTTGRLHPATRMALDRMWTLQREDGGFEWMKYGQPPSEIDDHYGVTVAAIGAGLAPDGYATTPAAKAGLDKIRAYLKSHPPAHLHHRAMRLLASLCVDGIMTADERQHVVQDLFALQKPDGGWGLATLGNWQRSDGKQQDTQSSDGYGTGFALYVLRRAGVPADDARLQRGLQWLKTHQRQSGRWFTRSLWKDQKHYLSHDGTAYAVLALAACGQL